MIQRQENINIDTWTQEIRLTSTGTNRIDLMIGGYLFKDKVDSVDGLDWGEHKNIY